MDFLNEQNNNNQIINNNNNNNVNKLKNKIPSKQISKNENSTQNNFEINNLFGNEEDLNNMNVKISEICDLNLLKLIIENSTTLPKGEIIFITPIGLIGSIRSKNFKEEGIFFGYYKNINNIYVDIDYMLPPSNIVDENNFISEEYKKNLLMSIDSKKYKSENNKNNNLFEEIENKNEGKFFKIFFDKKSEKYFIKDLGSGFGTFIRLMKDENYILKDNTLINIGNSFLIFSYSNNFDTNNNINDDNNNNINYFTNNYDSIENSNLYLKICSGENINSTFIFDNKNKVYTLGRNDKCDVIIHDKMLSRIHCIVCYDKNYNIWIIKDGGDKGMSTNGTWIFAFDEIEIKEGMIFKINANLLSCHFAN